MKRDEIYAELSKCKTLPELVGRASQMKRNGEKETVVNNVVTELRKKLMNTAGKVNLIKRTSLPSIVPQEFPYGSLLVQPNNLNAPVIFTEDNCLLI